MKKSHMELDLDSFLVSDSDSESDLDSSSVPHRTVDEILNASSSSSPSSSPPSSPPLIRDQVNRRNQNDPTRRLSEALSNVSVRPESVDSEVYRGFPRVSDPTRRNSPSTSSLRQLPLPSLFAGVRSNVKPGAALAAAVAASRLVPTPHAAIIKSRRASSASSELMQQVLGAGESVSNQDADDQEVFSTNGVSVGVAVGSVSVDEFRSSGGESRLEDEDNGAELASQESEANVIEVQPSDSNVTVADARDYEENSKPDLVTASYGVDAEGDVPAEQETMTTMEAENAAVEGVTDDTVVVSLLESSGSQHLNDSDGNSSSYSQSGDAKASNDEESSVGDVKNDDLDRITPDSKEEGVDAFIRDDGSSMSGISELVEERIEELEKERMSKREKLKSRSFRKQLDLAEEFEKKQAYTGLHWEEGAAAQPMRLEGVKIGSTNLGYFDVDANNLISGTISSQAFKRDHGSPQVLAVHLNFIAVGTSKGVIVVVPSKYSSDTADQMESKLIWLGLQGDRSLSPVTSVCFNQQGGLLLAGYGDGHVTVWDVQRASVAKVITEHTAPVVYAFFIGRDSQGSRQFKVITSDTKGVVFKHTFSWTLLLNMYSVKTQCLLDGQKNGMVLSASPLPDDIFGSSLASSKVGNTAVPSSSISSMMGGVVGVDSSWKLFNEDSSAVEEGVVIFVTYQTGLVVKLIPNLEVYAQLPRPEGVREGSMPYTAWKCSMENSSKEAEDRVSFLAIAWDRRVQVAKLVKSDLKEYAKWSLDSVAIGVVWLDDQLLVIPTVTGHLYLFTRDGVVIHQTNFSVDGSSGNDLISYHTYFTNVFGNPEKAYHNSVGVRGASVYILGTAHLVISRLLPWKERVDVLRRGGDWMGAFNMAMSLFNGQAHGVVDLPKTVDAIREAIAPSLAELLLSYVDEVFSYISIAFSNQIEKNGVTHEPSSGTKNANLEIEEQYNRVGGVAVEFCVHINRMDLLFDEIFSRFVAVQQRDTFLELLEPYILKDMLGSLPPEIMQALVEHYSRKGWLQRIEQCVLHMDISSLDFNQVVRICREHGLYGALLYLFNKGLDDFRSPLEELLIVLRNSERQRATTIGYRMLVYLKYCFLGLAFPPGHGTLIPTRLPSLRTELIQFLLEKSNVHDSSTCVKSQRIYLNLYHLLEMDTEATLDVLRYAFAENEMVNHENHLLESGEVSLESKTDSSMPEDGCNDMLIQNLIDALVLVLDAGLNQPDESGDPDGSKSDKNWPSKEDRSHLFEFVAYYAARGRVSIPKSILAHILEYLTSDHILRTYNISPKMRENQLLNLLKAVPETNWDAAYVSQLCETAHFYKVCGYIHTIGRRYVAALESYMKEADEPLHSFCYVNKMLSQLRGDEFTAFHSAIISRIPQLLELSREGAFFLIIDNLKDNITRILEQLHSHPRSLFLYLKTVIEVHLSGSLEFSHLRKHEAVDSSGENIRRDMPKEVEIYLEGLNGFPKFIQDNPVNVTDDMIELYVELLCKYEPKSVLRFLETFDSYRVEHCLRLCQEYGIIDAAAFLLERVGDAASALSLTLSGLNEKFAELENAVECLVSELMLGASEEASLELFSSALELKEVHDIQGVLQACIGLCQRNTPRLNPEESEILWFRFLDTFCEPSMDSYQEPRNVNEIYKGLADVKSLELPVDEAADTVKWRIPRSDAAGTHILRKLISQFIKEIVEGMIGYVRLPTIMSKLLSDNGTQEFGDFKLTILGMLGTYGFERRILDTAKSLIEEDTFYTMSLLKKGASHGYAPISLLCCICNCPLTKTFSTLRVRVFNCGHATHIQCEPSENEMSSSSSSSSSSSIHVASSGCPVCMTKKTTQRSSKGKSFYLDYGLISTVSSSTGTSQRTSLYSHENEMIDHSHSQQIPRFEILTNLQKDQRLVQIESLPRLRLSPPAVYHEKVSRVSGFTPGESSGKDTKPVKPSQSGLSMKMKAKGSIFRPRLAFGKEKTSRR
ncbi:vacuolar protein sorting-associated protein 8 homolog isoform X2 [Eutrema salsugineum]|uniref:vacuolar protein sorting-associated protein 8 homolog isoform X2 n=1 Tax=Eutrema salsugineum TaxID=72664 RepID=UPI000CED506E|nr:vacuolar protein sorting-associated protein 8 homolog isoform X2 [Eutrema salsugineum]